MSWKQGPLPANTWNWGGVVVKSDPSSLGFYFADFCGDHVIVSPGTPQSRRVEADDVAWYDNSLELPPTGAKGRAEART